MSSVHPLQGRNGHGSKSRDRIRRVSRRGLGRLLARRPAASRLFGRFPIAAQSLAYARRCGLDRFEVYGVGQAVGVVHIVRQALAGTRRGDVGPGARALREPESLAADFGHDEAVTLASSNDLTVPKYFMGKCPECRNIPD